MSDRPPLQRTLDVLFYAPVGLVLTAVDDLPTLAAKGRQHLQNAHVVGQFAVGRLQAWVTPPKPASPADEGADPSPPSFPAPPPRPPVPAPAAVNDAIPDYDTLSASQVVRRLDGLSPADLQAVYRHEEASRGRRTILHRAQQLLDGQPSAGGEAAPPAGGEPEPTADGEPQATADGEAQPSAGGEAESPPADEPQPPPGGPPPLDG